MSRGRFGQPLSELVHCGSQARVNKPLQTLGELRLPTPVGLRVGGPLCHKPSQPIVFSFQNQLISFEALLRTKLTAKINAPNEAELAAALEASLHNARPYRLSTRSGHYHAFLLRANDFDCYPYPTDCSNLIALRNYRIRDRRKSEGYRR